MAATMSLGPLLAFDFDGTLAPIVPRPGDARVPIGIARRLERLARMLPVAVITGRRIDDVEPRLGFRPRHIIGSHGAEDPDRPSPGAAAALEPLRKRLREHARALDEAGVDVEDKRLSVALHYRLAHDRQAAQSLITSLLRGADECMRIFGGKCVLNVMPADAPDKADALHALVRRCGAASAVFVGDDVNDEAVFQRAQPHWLTVRVGRDHPRSRARFFLDGHAEVGILLHRLLDLVEA